MVTEQLDLIDKTDFFHKHVQRFHVLRRVVDIRHDHMAHPYMLFMRVDDVDQRQQRVLWLSGDNLEAFRIRMLDIQQHQVTLVDGFIAVIVQIGAAGIDRGLNVHLVQRVNGFCQKFSLQQRFSPAEGHAALAAVIWLPAERPVNDLLNLDFFALVRRP